jgi:hypothetical protein
MKSSIFQKQNIETSAIPGVWVAVPAASHDISQLSVGAGGYRQLLEIEADVSDYFVYGPDSEPYYL